MTFLSKFVERTTSRGRPVAHGNTVVTPVSRALTVKLPYYNYVWNRPVAIDVFDGEETKQIAIVDVNLLVQISLVAIGLAAAAVTLLARQAIKSS